MTVIEASGLSFRYGARPVFEGIDLRFEGDEGLVCILGPNGVGKTTLIRCLAGLTEPTEGRVLVDGRGASSIPGRGLAERIAFVSSAAGPRFQSTVFDTVLMGRSRGLGLRMRNEDVSIAMDAMRVMGLLDLRDRYVTELSAGQFQRTMVARGLAQDTDVLMLDEPTSNLDIGYQAFIASFMREMARRESKLVIMICHDINLASKFADGIIMMGPSGRLHSYGPAEDVITEECISEVYGAVCDVITHEGRPAVLIRGSTVRCYGRGNAWA